MSDVSGYRLGPVRYISLMLCPEVDLAEPSKTGLTFVVVELSFIIAQASRMSLYEFHPLAQLHSDPFRDRCLIHG